MPKSTIIARAKQKGEFTQVRITIEHPMIGGRCSEDDDTSPHFIQEMHCLYHKQPVLSSQCGPGLAENPYFSFRFKGARQGDMITITWVDNKGNKDSLDVTIF